MVVPRTYGFSTACELKILPIFVFSTLFLVLVFLMPVIAYVRVGHFFNLLVFLKGSAASPTTRISR